MMTNFDDMLFQYCNTNCSGGFHLILLNSNIACCDKLEKFISIVPKKIPSEKNDFIPIGVCLKFIEKIRESNFFGEININIQYGKIREIKIIKIHKLKDINKFLSGPR